MARHHAVGVEIIAFVAEPDIVSFAKRAFELTLLGEDASLQHEFGMCGNAHVIGQAFRNPQRRAVQGARDLKFVMVDISIFLAIS